MGARPRTLVTISQCFSKHLLKKGQNLATCCFFSFFSKTKLQKNVTFTGVQTGIVGVEGEHADHLTATTSAHLANVLAEDKHLKTFISLLNFYACLAKVR